MPKRSGDRAYTRLKYMRSVPQLKIRRFTMGIFKTDYKYSVALVATHEVRISGAAIESARITANKLLQTVSEGQYFLKVAAYPHEIVREHKLMAFAGADRLSQGMSRSFGKARKRAVRLSANKAILIAYVNEDCLEIAKTALNRASKKLPIPYKVLIREN